MSVELPVPSERNFEVYAAVEWGGMSLRAAAEKTGISPTRVREIYDQVERWITANAQREFVSPRAALRVAFEKHRYMLDYLRGQAMACFRGESDFDVPKQEKVAQPKYLMAAGRFSHAKCMATLLQLKAEEALRRSEEGADAPPALAPAAKPTLPPDGVCAPLRSEDQGVTFEPVQPDAVSTKDPYTCDVAEVLRSTAPRENRRNSDPARRKSEAQSAAREKDLARQRAALAEHLKMTS